MKLQVGSGDHRVAPALYKRADWVNVDIVTVPGLNVKATGTKLPFKNDSFEEIHCTHVLEHVTRDKYKPMLSEMYRVLKPGGHAYVEVPDFQGTVQCLTDAFAAGDTQAIHIWTTSVYGKSEREGMSHHWGFYEGLLRREFRDVGFAEVARIVDKDKMLAASHWKQEPVLLVRGVK